MPTNNLEQNPDFIEARYSSGGNPYDVEFMAAAPEIISFGSGGTDSAGGTGGGNLTVNSNLIQITSRHIDRIGCPALDQYVLALDRKSRRNPIAKIAGIINLDDYLYNPLTGKFARVKWRQMILQPTARVNFAGGGETVVSWSHPLIASGDAEGCKKIEDCDLFEKFYVCSRDGRRSEREPVISIKYAGWRWTMAISLETGFVYATSKRAEADAAFVLGHNKAIMEDEL